MAKTAKTISIKLTPATPGDAVVRFLAEAGATLEVVPTFSGEAQVTLRGRSIERYDSVRGTIASEWSITRTGTTLNEAIVACCSAYAEHIHKSKR